MLIKEDGSRYTVSPKFGGKFTDAEIANHLGCGAIFYEEWYNMSGESFRVYFGRQDINKKVNRAFVNIRRESGLFTNFEPQLSSPHYPNILRGDALIVASSLCN